MKHTTRHATLGAVSDSAALQRQGIVLETHGRYFQAKKTEFLDVFFGGYKDWDVSDTEHGNWKSTFEGKYSAETDVYDPIIKLLNDACKSEPSKLTFVNVHTSRDQKVTLNNPDFFAVDPLRVAGTPCCDISMGAKPVTNVCWLHAEVVGDIKLGMDDPFETKLELSRKREDALKQLLHYLFDISQIQHRTSAILIFIFKRSARLLRWDPQRIVYTDTFDFREKDDQKQFIQFVKAFAASTPTQRGANQLFSPAPQADIILAEAVFKAHMRKIEAAGFDNPIISGEPYWEIAIPLSVSEDGPENSTSPPSLRPGLLTRKVIAVRLGKYRGSLCGRNAKYFAAWDRQKPSELIFVEASWSYTGEGRLMESAIYEELEKKKVGNVQRMLYGGCAVGPE
ncbi:hypothetical protein BT69DRAFT_155173 [Atractiella rhizophila]|nr:hypothetical protein BT69DRAFT_155173 [Atractiella rhizophila]